MDQLCVNAGIGRNSISWRFFVCESAGVGPCNLEIHEIHVIFGRVRRFHGLLRQINICLENFMSFAEKMIIIGFGHCHGNLVVK